MTIFMGSGDQANEQRARLHRLLDEALDALGGAQQPEHWDHNPSTEEHLSEKTAADRAARTIRSAVAEIAGTLGQHVLLIDVLQDLKMVTNKYSRRPEAVSLSLDYHAGAWLLMRDDQAGGGPWRRGPRKDNPTEAVSGFIKMVEAGNWSPPEP